MPSPRLTIWETIMRFTPAAVVAALILSTVSTSSVGAPPQVAAISPLSIEMQREAERLQAQGQLDEATGYFETALLADPRNANAYIGLAQIAQVQSLPGKAVGLFREALELEPENRTALAGQGVALIERGAVERARGNLARLQTLCGAARCVEVARLTSALATAGQRTALRTEEVAPQPMVSGTPIPESH